MENLLKTHFLLSFEIDLDSQPIHLGSSFIVIGESFNGSNTSDNRTLVIDVIETYVTNQSSINSLKHKKISWFIHKNSILTRKLTKNVGFFCSILEQKFNFLMFYNSNFGSKSRFMAQKSNKMFKNIFKFWNKISNFQYF